MASQILHKTNIRDIYPLTPLQQGMYFHFLRGHRQTYYCQMSYRVRGHVNERVVKEAFSNLFYFHPVLKTICVSQSGKMMGVILNDVQVEMNFFNISGQEEIDKKLAAFKEEDRARSFDLEKELLMRLLLVKVGEEYYEFIWSHHHLIMDGWSLGILINDFYTLYQQLDRQQSPVLTPASYTTFLQWLEKQDLSASRTYWHNYLLHYEQPSSLKQVNDLPFKEGRVHRVMDQISTRRLMRLAARERVTLNTIVQAIWGIVLSKYKDRLDVVFGTVVSGRSPAIADVEHMVGLFINTLPMRVKFNTDTTFSQLLQQVWKDIAQSELHQFYPLVEIQNDSPLKDQLFDHLLVFENFPVTEQLANGLHQEATVFRIERVEAVERTHYDFNLLVSCRQDELSFEYKFNSNCYAYSFIERLNEKIFHLAKQVVGYPDTPIVDLQLGDINHIQRSGMIDKEDREVSCTAIPGLFIQYADDSPTKIAVEEQDRVCTYGYLKQQVLRLSCLLQSKQLPVPVIPVVAGIQNETIIALLGILLAGNAFLIVDPSWPGERIRYVLRDINPSLVITTSAQAKNIPSGYEIIIVDQEQYPVASSDYPDALIDMNDPACVRYLPVEGEDPAALVWDHQTLSRELLDFTFSNNILAKDRLPLSTSASITSAVYSLLGCITAGASIRLSEDVTNELAKWEPSRLLNGQQQYILSHTGQLQDIGMEGEIAISGTALPSGYLNRPELTRRKLVYNDMFGITFFLTAKRGRQEEGGKIIVVAGNENMVTVKKEPVSLNNKPVTVPRDEVEKRMRSLWASVLEKDEEAIDIRADFFQCGGHSLKAIRLNSMIQKNFNIKLSIDQLFSSPTIEGLAKEIKAVEWAHRQKRSAGSAGINTIKI